jgi:hypothetical protein
MKPQSSFEAVPWACVRPLDCRMLFLRSLELGELLRSAGSTPTLCTLSLQGIEESLEVML